jgi:hypothetical protein
MGGFRLFQWEKDTGVDLNRGWWWRLWGQIWAVDNQATFASFSIFSSPRFWNLSLTDIIFRLVNMVSPFTLMRRALR